MASSPITSWQIEGEMVEAVTDILFLGSKITVEGDCNHEIRRRLLHGRKAMTKLDSMLKSRDITRQKGLYSQGDGLPSSHVWLWELNKAECQRIDAFNYGAGEESPLDSKEIKPILREINPEYSLEGLMMKLKL